jgi:hypothetical protein
MKGEGTGTSVNISSGGVLFSTDDHLPPGTNIEVTVSWPVLRDADVRLRLIGLGRVVRSEDGIVAIEFQRHELCAEAIQSSGITTGSQPPQRLAENW